MAKFSDDMIALAVEGRRAVVRYPFPGVEGAECGIRLLTNSENDRIRLEAVTYCKTKKADLALDPEFLDKAIYGLTVYEAFVDPDKPDDRFFEDIDDVRGLDAKLTRTLYELYITHQESMDPLSRLSREEVDALVAQLGKSEISVARLSLFDRDTLQSCVLSMACVLRETRPTSK